MQRKSYKGCKIAFLNIDLELKAERDNAEVCVDNVKEYQKVVDAEWQILYNKLQEIADSRANVVLSKLRIGDVATQWFADRDIFCAVGVTEEDLKRTFKTCGGVLGHCDRFEEKQIGGKRFNIDHALSSCEVVMSSSLKRQNVLYMMP